MYVQSATRRSGIALLFSLAAGGLLWLGSSFAQAASATEAAPATFGKPVRDPLPYRIVSFHRGRANKNIIVRAAGLGFNGVMFQIEGSTVKGLEEFAKRNAREDYVDFCHQLGMEVTLWVHELSDIPGPDDPGYMGPVTLDNKKLWDHMDARYEWLFGELLPDIDGIVLTVVETQIRATDTPLMIKLVNLLQDKCEKYGKKLIVRTFTWHPEELAGVLGCVRQMPEGSIIMTKCVPQDWQMRGIHHKAIGNVGKHQEIIEYDIAGEYFLLDYVANCMPEKLKEHFDYGLEKGVDGVCVRVDRWEAEVLNEPSEVNLWALGMFASGQTDSVDDVWTAWAVGRFGPKAAQDVIAALKPTQFVVTEMMCVGTFTFGNGRDFPPHVDGRKSAFHTNWANWRWDKSYVPEYEKARTGDPAYVADVKKAKAKAAKLAQESLDKLEVAKPNLRPQDYQILYTRLWTNQIQLEFRSAMMLAYLQYRRIENTDDPAEKKALAQEIRGYLQTLYNVADRKLPQATKIEYRGEVWKVGRPRKVEQDKIRAWADKMEKFLKEKGL